MFSKKNCPIQEQISNANDTIEQLMQRIELLETSLKSPNLMDDKRKIMETEINEIKKLLSTNKDLLADLHKENSKSFALTASLVFACFLLYGVYVMIYGA
ncbi:hypothetical protein HA402_003099 [Bradysia odoriphaga]|nr:hypothetical protein HA402_003099 [Bradysia odoriphaga]